MLSRVEQDTLKFPHYLTALSRGSETDEKTSLESITGTVKPAMTISLILKKESKYRRMK